MHTTSIAHVIDSIPFALDIPALLKRVRVHEGSDLAAELLPLAEQAVAYARPKACYLAAPVTGRGENFVEIEGVRFTSSALREKTQYASQVFVYLATCGQELQAWGDGIEDMVHRFWADALKELALKAALQALNEHIDATYHPGATSVMRPGFQADWPIEQQRALFDLLGGCVEVIEVRLTDSMLMIPSKTLSGIRFPTEEQAGR